MFLLHKCKKPAQWLALFLIKGGLQRDSRLHSLQHYLQFLHCFRVGWLRLRLPLDEYQLGAADQRFGQPFTEAACIPQEALKISYGFQVANTTKAPCRTQREIAAQNSYLDSVKEKKEVVYAAPCDTDKPKEAPAKVAAASRG